MKDWVCVRVCIACASGVEAEAPTFAARGPTSAATLTLRDDGHHPGDRDAPNDSGVVFSDCLSSRQCGPCVCRRGWLSPFEALNEKTCERVRERGTAYFLSVQLARVSVSEHANVTQHVSRTGRLTHMSRSELFSLLLMGKCEF